ERPVRGKLSEIVEHGGRPNPKILALGPLSSDVRTGKVLLVRGGGNDALIDEAEAFPTGRHDDQLAARAPARRGGPRRGVGRWRWSSQEGRRGSGGGEFSAD